MFIFQLTQPSIDTKDNQFEIMTSGASGQEEPLKTARPKEIRLMARTGELKGDKTFKKSIGAKFLVSVMLISVVQFVSCNQNHISSQEQQISSGANEQNSFNQGAFGSGEYSLIGADGLMSLAGSGGGFASKRARKISAFMPMRGRKDGRDERGVDIPVESGQLDIDSNVAPDDQSNLFGPVTGTPPRESDGETSILRLLARAPAEAQPQLGLRTLRWLTAPHQFAAQFAIQHNQQQQQQQQQQQHQVHIPSQMRTYESVDSDSGLDGLGLVPGAPIMQAKLRRAFHPMRGKKSFSQFDSGDEF